MCHGCYIEYGSPTVENDRVLEASGRIRDVYDISPVGGNLHVVLDDWNLEDESLDMALEFIRQNLHGLGDSEIEVEKSCLGLLKELTVEERASALHLAFSV